MQMQMNMMQPALQQELMLCCEQEEEDCELAMDKDDLFGNAEQV